MSTKINYEVLKSLTLIPEKESTDEPMFSRIRLNSVSEPSKANTSKPKQTDRISIKKDETVEEAPVENEKEDELGKCQPLFHNKNYGLVFSGAGALSIRLRFSSGRFPDLSRPKFYNFINLLFLKMRQKLKNLRRKM